jgi:hypothetical protein
MCVNVIPGHTYYEYSVWVLKSGMTVAYVAAWVSIRTHPTPPTIRGWHQRDCHFCSPLVAAEWTLDPYREEVTRHVEEGTA